MERALAAHASRVCVLVELRGMTGNRRGKKGARGVLGRFPLLNGACARSTCFTGGALVELRGMTGNRRGKKGARRCGAFSLTKRSVRTQHPQKRVCALVELRGMTGNRRDKKAHAKLRGVFPY